MSKEIDISEMTVRTPHVIKVDGVTYPRTQHNINAVEKYWATDDETELNKLSLAVISFEYLEKNI